MHSAALFHVLPHFILKDIIEHAARLSQTKQNYSEVNPVWRENFCSLLGTCRSWREAALSVMYSCCVISIDQAALAHYKTAAGDIELQESCLHHMYFTRYLEVSVSYESISSGHALGLLSNSALASAYFANVRRLELTIMFDTGKDPDGLAVSPNVHKFFQHLNDIAPSITTIDANLHEKYYYGNSGYQGNVCGFLQKFFDLRPTASQHGEFHLSTLSDHLFMKNITTMTCEWNENHSAMAAVVHANSSTLNWLSIDFSVDHGIEDIFFDNANQPVVYSNLKKMSFLTTHGVIVQKLSSYPDLIPFPMLKVLIVDIHYPFTDDIIFRGNSKTLQELFLQSSPKIISSISRYEAFAEQKLTNLNIIWLKNKVKEGDIVADMADGYMKTIGSVLSSIKELIIYDKNITDSIPQYLSENKAATNISVLRLHSMHIPISTMLKLLHSMPTIQLVWSMVSGWTDEFPSKDAFKMAEYINNTFPVLNSQFQKWVITNTGFLPHKMTIFSILMLSDLCPFFEFAAFFERPLDDVKDLFVKLQGSKLYASCKHKYTPALTNKEDSPSLYIKRNIALPS